ncbi:hypothetical protein PoB_005409700 [Plakobranchus ocellatus]|uniref:Uncharacterized protein n=1 Tax=Plakobranchus ocellatus TaxID=259542 RepID=A0AAV4C896_9GAST|nr:hypothetical protein PoB_005409700 [Plakobranchus ocellatus]
MGKCKDSEHHLGQVFVLRTEQLCSGMINSAVACHQDDLRVLSPPSDQGIDAGAPTRDSRIPAELMADSLLTVPPTPRTIMKLTFCYL